MRTAPVHPDAAASPRPRPAHALGRLASPRLTIAGFALLGAGVFAAQSLAGASVWLIAAPLVLLALNLAAALWLLPRLRRGGLGLFHFCLLGFLLLVAFGRLTHFDGHLSIVDGQEFDPAAVEIDSKGPWHGDGLRRLAFRQGPWTVGYATGVRREKTHSNVALPGEAGEHWETVGDDTPLALDGYRFYTTHNKGFAPILTWIRPGQEPITGAVMLPSYPANDWQQVQRWTAPGGEHWQFALRTPPVVDQAPWRLEAGQTPSVLIAEAGGRRFELRPGEQVQTAAGTLRYEWLAGWMGYRIFYDPTLIPLFALSLIGVAGLAWHLWGHRARLLPLGREASA